eukprot:7882377-Alexandrium_andersonii.AAC.1
MAHISGTPWKPRLCWLSNGMARDTVDALLLLQLCPHDLVDVVPLLVAQGGETKLQDALPQMRRGEGA